MTAATRLLIRMSAALLMVAFHVAAHPVWASETRVALVIGNSDYDHVSALTNPVNDTTDLGAALERIGFDVTIGHNLDYRGMRLALRDFAEAAETADVVLIYFAGHGIEIDKVNYLIPTNAELRSDRDVEFETVRLDAVIRSISDTRGLKIVLVDACRNNPFLSNMTRTSATRSLGRGLGRIDPGGVLVGYAARGGTLALDGDGRNSPYAKALLQHIEEPGLELGKLFRKVRDTVFSLTDGFQEPFTYGSLPGEDIFLVPAVQPAPAPVILPALSPAQPETDQPSLEQTANADALLREAIQIKDNQIKQGMLSMIARLYPETQSGRTAKYMAEHIERQLATIRELGKSPEKKKYDTSGIEASIAALGEAASEGSTSRVAAVGPPITLNNNAFVRTNEDVENELRLSRSDYRIIQRGLNDQGFNAGVEDGIFGPRSRAALRNYQTSRGETRTGYLTVATVAALKAASSLPRSAEQATPVAQPAPATPQPTDVGFDGTYIIEIRRRPDPRYKDVAHESIKTMMRLEYRKSGDSFMLLSVADYSGKSGRKPRIRSASLSDSGALRIRGTVNYLFGKVRPTNVYISRQIPADLAKGSSVVSEHGRFDDAFFVNVKVTRR